MAIKILSLSDGTLGATFDDIFSTSTHSKAAMVRNMSFVNTHDTITANLSVAFRRTVGGTGTARLITPSPVSIPPHGLYTIEEEVTLEYNGVSPATIDSIQAKAVQAGTSTAATVD